jgi:hypothetical protein
MNNVNERCSDIEKLEEPFKTLVKKLIELLVSNHMPFEVFETWRSVKRQGWLFDHRHSKVLHSRHQDGMACDFVHRINGRWDWDDIKAYQRFGVVVKQVPGLRWGGDWKSFRDYVHVEYDKDTDKAQWVWWT